MKNMKTYIKKFLICLFILALPHINSTSKAMDEEREKQNCEHCSGLRQNCFKVKDNGHGATGEWLNGDIPKRNWTCHGATDLGSARKKCDMCGTMLRYAHHMTHGFLKFDVGCTCAAYMTGELDTEESIKELKLEGKKRQIAVKREREVKKKDIPLSKKKNKIQLNDSDESSDDSNDSNSSYGDSNDSDSNYDDDNDD